MSKIVKIVVHVGGIVGGFLFVSWMKNRWIPRLLKERDGYDGDDDGHNNVGDGEKRTIKTYRLRRRIDGVPVFAIDIDEVLGQFVVQLADWHNEVYGTSLNLMSFHNYDFSKVWGGSKEAASAKMEAYFQSEHFANLPIIPGALEVLNRYKERCNFVVVTSRHATLYEVTCHWLEVHYPNIFCDIRFGNHWASKGVKVSKPEMCRELGACVLVDDSYHYARQCSQMDNFHVLLFDYMYRYNWSKGKPNLKNVHRVPSWNDVGLFFNKYLNNAK